MSEIVFLNGKFIARPEAKLPLLSPGFLYGWGLFETMRSYRNRIVYFKEHLERIKNSAELLEIGFPYSLSRLREIIERTVKINGFQDAYVRLTLWKSATGTDTFVLTRRYKPYPSFKYRRGFRVCISGFRQNEDSFLARLKTTNYLAYQLCYAQAQDKGYDEALILNNRGYICEASRSNIFFIKDSEIFTPALECGCLGGITRGVVFDLAKKYKMKIYEGNFTIQDLYAADGAFLTNSLIGVMPLASLGKRKIDVAKLTRFLMQNYNLLLKNGS